MTISDYKLRVLATWCLKDRSTEFDQDILDAVKSMDDAEAASKQIAIKENYDVEYYGKVAAIVHLQCNIKNRY